MLKKLSEFKSLFLITPCLIFCAACASKSEITDLRSSTQAYDQKLREENKDLKQKMERLEKLLDESSRQLEEKIESAKSPVQSKQADMWAEMQTLQVEQAKLMGKVDALEREMSILKDGTQNASAENKQNLAAMIRRHEEYWKIAQDELDLNLDRKKDKLADKQKPKSRKEKVLDPEKKYDFKSPEEMYKKALRLFYDRKYDQAQSLWQAFNKKYPDHSLVPNAWFWQGEAYFQMQDYAHAVLDYQKVIADYSSSNKYKPSMLKQGMTFFKMGKNKAGRLVLEELIDKFPDSTEARRAQGFLANIE